MANGSVKCVDSSNAAADPTLPEKIIEVQAGGTFVVRGASGAVYRWAPPQIATKIISP